MSVIAAGINVAAFDGGRGIVPPINAPERPIQNPDPVKPSAIEGLGGTRFGYDREMKRSFVEFRDDESGRVISRFPAEQNGGEILARDVSHAAAQAKLLDILA